jgi:hypothetical protein
LASARRRSDETNTALNEGAKTLELLCPSDLPVKNLDRPKWPEFATEASAI